MPDLMSGQLASEGVALPPGVQPAVADVAVVVDRADVVARVAAAVLRNADRFVSEGVNLVIESQISTKVAAQLTSKFSSAGVPLIAIDVPHPGAIYFGADNYKAGKIGGQCLGQWVAKHWDGAVDQIVFAEVDASGHVLDARLTGMYDGILKLLPECRHAPVFHYEIGR